LYCWGPTPPETEAVNWTPAPTGDGADREELIRVKRSGVDVVVVVGGGGGAGADVAGAEIGYGKLTFEFALSYASAVLLALRTHTATRAPESALFGLHVHWLLDVHVCVTTQLEPL
jgi:hypothetical protein